MPPFSQEDATLNGWDMPAEPAPGIDMDELVSALQREADAANSEYDRVSGLVDLAIRFYEAKPFGNEVDGRSQIIMPDVQETVDYMATSVLRPFVSGDKVVEFEATDESEEEAVQIAAAAVNFSFMRDQDGYRMLLDWTNCGLLEKLGVAKTMVTTEERVKRETVQVVDPVELEQIDAEIEDATENEDGSLSVTLKRVIKRKRSTDESVPLAEFRYSPCARHEDTSDYLAHCPVKTRSDLVDMGFDREQVYALPTYDKVPDGRADDRYDNDPESTSALQKVWLWEEYARIDIDGDGIAERVKIFRVDDQILRWADGEPAIETVDDQPFSIFCPFPRAHRIDGWSLADKVLDIQLGRSTVVRQLLDGLNFGNMPRPIVSSRGSNENTIDDLLSPIPGAPIRVDDPTAVQPFVTGFDVGKSLTVAEWFTGERESRTGITRLNQGLDADALNKTATGTAMMQAQGQQQEEFIARNLGEALSRLFAKKYRMMRAECDPFKIKVDGKYMMVDPATWPEEVNMNLRVGLGTGSKDKRIQARMMLAPILADGFQNKQVTPKHLFHAVDGLVRDLGIGQGDDFWKDPDAPPEIDPNTGQPVQEQEQLDPEVMAAQAEQQREQAKMEFEQQKVQAQMQLDREKAEATLTLQQQKDAADIQAQRERHALEMEQQREKAALEATLARDKASAEADIAIYRIDREAEVKRYAADRNQAQGDNIGQNREGGALDA